MTKVVFPAFRTVYCALYVCELNNTESTLTLVQSGWQSPDDTKARCNQSNLVDSATDQSSLPNSPPKSSFPPTTFKFHRKSTLLWQGPRQHRTAAVSRMLETASKRRLWGDSWGATGHRRYEGAMLSRQGGVRTDLPVLPSAPERSRGLPNPPASGWQLPACDSMVSAFVWQISCSRQPPINCCTTSAPSPAQLLRRTQGSGSRQP